MLKKLVFPILCLLFLCGCEATYNLDISEGFLETTTINSVSDGDTSLMEGYPRNLPAYYTDSFNPEDTSRYDDISYYEASYQSDGVLSYTYKFQDKYNLSTIAKESMPKITIDKDKTVRIHATGNFDCFSIYNSLEKLTINIKAPYEIVYQNADYINGDTYTWIINKDNPMGTIDLEYKNPDYEDNLPKSDDLKKMNNNNSNNKKNNSNDSETNTKKTSNAFVLLLSGLFFIVLFGIIIFMNKYKKNN